jgi:SAM-dependent methyltransferase
LHDTAYQIGRQFIELYFSSKHNKIIEVGSLDVNGSLRDFKPDAAGYIGIDFESGAGVDIVSIPGEPIPAEDKSADCVIASSVFEHDGAFWNTFLELCRITRNGGYIYINAPSNGTVHRYPEDCWRFYPDAGIALERWARKQSYDIHLIESFTCNRKNDHWNDFVAVFRMGSGNNRSLNSTIFSKFTVRNVWFQGEFLGLSTSTEDMEIMEKNKSQLHELEKHNIPAEFCFIKEKLAVIETTLSEKQSGIENQLSTSTDKIQILEQKLSTTEELLANAVQEISDSNKNHAVGMDIFEINRIELENKIKKITDESERKLLDVQQKYEAEMLASSEERTEFEQKILELKEQYESSLSLEKARNLDASKKINEIRGKLERSYAAWAQKKSEIQRLKFYMK